MRVNKWSMLAGCISLAVAGSAWAAQSETHTHFNKKVYNPNRGHVHVVEKKGQTLLPHFAENSTFGELFNNSHANIKLRTVYFKQHLPKGKRAGTANAKSDANQNWDGSAFGAQFNFHSGFAFNHIGFDWSLFNALSLSQGGNDSKAANQFFPQKANGHLRSDIFIPDALADVKFVTGGKNLNLKGKVGYIEFNSDFLAGSGSRALPASYRGLHLDGHVYGLNVYMNLANALRLRSARGMQNFTNKAGDKISYIGEMGLGYTFHNGLGLQASYGEGHKYIKEYEGQAMYAFDLPDNAKLNLKGQYFHAKKGGHLWNPADTGFKSSADAGTLSAVYHLGGLKLGGAYTKTYAKGGLGFYQYKLAGNEYGSFNTPTSVDSDFNKDGENAYQASVDYKFDKAMSGLEASVIYTLGNGIDTNNQNIHVKSEHEIDYSIIYAFQRPMLKGLSLKVIDYDLYQKGVNDGYKDGHLNDLRIYADYTLAVF